MDGNQTAVEALPPKPGTPLQGDQVEVERNALARIGGEHLKLLYAAVALLLTVPATQGFLDPPYFWRGALWAALAFSIVTLTAAAYGRYLTEKAQHRLDATHARQRRTPITMLEDGAVLAFFLGFASLTVFIGMNAIETLRNDRVAIDLVADSYIAEPGAVVIVEALVEDADSFRWQASSGRLLDDDEQSVAWLADSIDGELPMLATLSVTIRRNHLFYSEEIGILVRSSAMTGDAFQDISYRIAQTLAILDSDPIMLPPPPLPCSSLSLIDRWFVRKDCMPD
jgi:hypothetical protein